MSSFPGMRIPWKGLRPYLVVLVLFCFSIQIGNCQDDDDEAPAPPKDQGLCNGIFVTYTFSSREKIYPLVKNASAQAWKFSSQVMILNSGTEELKSWKVYIGFQHHEILVSVDGAQVVDADEYPVRVGKNGTTITGYPNTDLKTAIETAADFTQIQASVDITGTQFGMKTGTPMPKTIRLVNDGFKCPAPKKQSNTMHVCCHKDPKFKSKALKTKFMPRQYGDLSLTYDVLQAYEGYYQAQVTMDNFHPLGRLDHWNLTWEWMRGEFIYNMRGAYTHKKDSSECIYGPQGQYYKSFDFTPVVNCERKPTISDLPAERENDEKVGKLPYCCRNGSLLPTIMNETQSRAIFQLQVQKMPPDLNRTAFYPPQRWKINGVLNPDYKCGPPVRIDPTEFPDTSGLAAKSYAVASWQVTCNITKPKPKQARCCVSFSAYYADSAVPCPTCACGCDDDLVSGQKCDANGTALPLPPESLLVPFANRTTKIKAWAAIKHKTLPKKLPCPDNCGLSINWHVDSDYKTGWAARITLFNWQADSFKDWFAAINIKKAYPGYENIYSFNGTKLPGLNNTLFFQGLKGLEQLNGIVNGSKPASDPPVPGKQQSVISFLKKNTPGINVAIGDGFPTRVLFNGEECALPTEFPKRSGVARRSSGGGFVVAVVVGIVSFVLVTDRLG